MNGNDCYTFLDEKDAKKYQDEYVTVSDQHSKKVICHGKNVVKVYEETQRLGFKDPIIIYIPIYGEDFTYSAKDSPILDVYA
jgi:hypothetical protein